MNLRLLSLALAAILVPKAHSQAPTLTPTFSTDQLTLSWSADAVDWSLETSPTVGSSAPWTRITSGISIEGPRFTWSGPLTEASAFFRLSNIGDPLAGPERQWTWVDFPQSFAMEGTTLGLGINLNTDKSKVVIYLNGGGVCWDEQTCYVQNTAARGPFTGADFTNSVAPLLNFAWAFNRSNPQNPFRDYSYIFVPYFTGDLHAGSNEINHGDHPTKHVGYRNIAAYLRRLVATFPNATRVVLVGASGGGYGAFFNWGQVQEAFARARVDVIDDSGPFLASSALFNAIANASWNLNVAMPDDCADCASNPAAIVSHYAAKYPRARAAFLSYQTDNVIPGYYQINPSDFPAALNVFLDTQILPNNNLRHFIAPGSGHVLLSQFSPPTSGGVSLLDFLTKMINDDPTWPNVRP